jgi:methyl-accepting chemotaxis protein
MNLKFLKEATIRQKLLFAFISVGIVALLIGTVGITYITVMNRQDKAVHKHVVQAMGDLTSISATFYRIQLSYRDMVIANDPIEVQKIINLEDTLFGELDILLKKNETTLQTDEEKKIFRKLDSAAREMREFLTPLQMMALQNSDSMAYAYLSGNYLQLVRNVEMAIENLTKNKIDLGEKISEKNNRNASIASSVMIFLIIIGFSISIILGYFIAANIGKIVKSINSEISKLTNAAINGELSIRGEPDKINFEFREIVTGINAILDSVMEPLDLATNYIERISKGELPPVINKKYKGEYLILKNSIENLILSNKQIIEKAKLMAQGDLSIKLDKRSDKDELMVSLNEMVKRIGGIIIQFQQAADIMAKVSNEISSGAQLLSKGATEQASASEEISSSVEEMVSNIQQNTDNAQQAEKITLAVNNNIKKCASSTATSVSAMKEIAGKIGIIGEITFQTNLLALNAAVEAARAGEHGKGFAVVAAEVRKLAERSKIAADEINHVSKEGVNIAINAGEQLDEIVPEVERTFRFVQEISAAGLEQNSGADQINISVQQLNQINQKNAAASEELATNAEELTNQAEHLRDLIAFFKIQEEIETSEFVVEKSMSPEKQNPTYIKQGKFNKPDKVRESKAQASEINLEKQGTGNDMYETY